jgi:hypothetical protein
MPSQTTTPSHVLRERAARAATVKDVRRIVADALVLGTSDAATIAARAVEQHAPGLRSDRLIGEVVRRLETFADDEIGQPTSWTDWIAWCASGEMRPRARDVVEEFAASWGPIRGDEIDFLTATVTEATTVTAQNLRSSLGLLMEHLGVERGTPQRHRLLRAAIELLAHGGPTSHDERQATLAWVEELCAAGSTRPAMSPSLSKSRRSGDRSHLSAPPSGSSTCSPYWSCHRLDQARHPPQGTASLHRALSQVRGWVTALDTETRDTLVRTADLLGIELHGIATTDTRSDPLTALQDRTLAIHTLMTSSARTCVAAIRQAAPDCQIDINSDHVATDQLAALATNADVFVLVTGAAKHAASRAVERHRPPGKPLIRVDGKGATALLRDLRTAMGEYFTSAA